MCQVGGGCSYISINFFSTNICFTKTHKYPADASHDYIRPFRVINSGTLNWSQCCKVLIIYKICHFNFLALCSHRWTLNLWSKPTSMREENSQSFFCKIQIAVWLHKLAWLDCWNNWKCGNMCGIVTKHTVMSNHSLKQKDWRMWFGPRSLIMTEISKMHGESYMPSPRRFVNQLSGYFFSVLIIKMKENFLLAWVLLLLLLSVGGGWFFWKSSVYWSVFTENFFTFFHRIIESQNSLVWMGP